VARKKAVDETLIQIEETQAALRDCIEQAKGLVEDSERLVRQHRDEIAEPAPSSRAD
jgi:hypothetical protein